MSTLTIILGKNIGQRRVLEGWRDESLGLTLFYPEIKLFGHSVLPLHADDFVLETVEQVKHLVEDSIPCQLFTQSEYLVSWICQEVGKGKIPAEAVEIRLYSDDNSSFRKFAVSEDGVMCADGDGDWPFGWFMPSDFKY